MKNLFISLLLSTLILLSSCTTTLFSSTKKREIDSVLQTGKTYKFLKTDGTKANFRVVTIQENKIMGKNEEGRLFEIEKDQISEIKKNNTVGTVLIVAGTVAGVLIIPAYAGNKPVGH